MIAALEGGSGDAVLAAVQAYSAFMNLPDEREAGALMVGYMLAMCAELFTVQMRAPS